MKGTALVTGGAKRIGKAIALSLADAGWNIALHYRSSAHEAVSVCDDVRNRGVEGTCFQCDLDQIEEVVHLIPEVHRAFPDLNVLINNASVFGRVSFKDTDPKTLEHFWSVNLRAPFFLTQSFAGQCSGGNIINILDTKVNRNSIAYLAYTLSKKNLADFTRMAAKILGPAFRVNGISPGPILPSSGMSRSDFEKLGSRLPLQTTGHPLHIINAVHFCLENAFITGEIINVDGGEHLT